MLSDMPGSVRQVWQAKRGMLFLPLIIICLLTPECRVDAFEKLPELFELTFRNKFNPSCISTICIFNPAETQLQHCR